MGESIAEKERTEVDMTGRRREQAQFGTLVAESSRRSTLILKVDMLSRRTRAVVTPKVRGQNVDQTHSFGPRAAV